MQRSRMNVFILFSYGIGGVVLTMISLERILVVIQIKKVNVSIFNIFMKLFKLDVNGKSLEVEVEGDTPLLWVLRDYLGLTGTKFGCGKGFCGACTVHINGKAQRSCGLAVSSISEDTQITTIEGLAKGGTLTPLQQAWCDLDVAQCGYCQAGQIMSATALLNEKAKPSEGEINEAMAGNICRCATYTRIREAIQTVAKS